MTKIAAATGLGRESLYKSLSPNGNPELATVLKVMRAAGLRLHALPRRRRSRGIAPAPIQAWLL